MSDLCEDVHIEEVGIVLYEASARSFECDIWYHLKLISRLIFKCCSSKFSLLKMQKEPQKKKQRKTKRNEAIKKLKQKHINKETKRIT